MEAKPKNRIATREAWLSSAVDAARPYFEKLGYRLPDNIRVAIAFTSLGKAGTMKGECWSPVGSADSYHEIIIRNDLAEPLEVLGALYHELVHAVAGPGHGKAYRDVALRIGLEGPMRYAAPGPMLRERLAEISNQLGPFPHAKLDFATFTLAGGLVSDRKKKQTTRLLKAECQGKACGYTVRLAAKWLEIGPPHCPKHGAMHMPSTEERVG